jgi:hypothetical protein
MMFLEGHKLTARMAQLTSKAEELKIAIAYWGANALSLLGLDASAKRLEMICCLKGGKSDPDVVGLFGKRARQCDRLHAKVIWTPRGAIVGSANASSNGMPSEENLAAGLIEAGMFVDDPRELIRIRTWFDRMYGDNRRTRRIDEADLEAARLERQGWGEGPSGGNKARKSLLDALQQGGRKEFENQRIAFVFWKEDITSQENTSARRYLKQNSATIMGSLQIDRSDLRKLAWYTDFKNLPPNTYLIDCHYRDKRTSVYEVCKTFDRKKGWPISVDGETELFTFALKPPFVGFNYKITKEDKAIIRNAAPELWKRAKGDEDGKVLDLIDAASILLKYKQ